MTTQRYERGVPEWTMGDRLRKAREVLGLGQREFAEEIGVSHQTVTNAEKGHRSVRKITLNAWSLATGVPVEWLETGVGDPTPAPTDPRRGSGGDLDRLTEAKRSRARRGGPRTAGYVAAA